MKRTDHTPGSQAWADARWRSRPIKEHIKTYAFLFLVVASLGLFVFLVGSLR